MSIDLQNYDGIVGYDFDKSLIEKENQHKKIEINIL